MKIVKVDLDKNSYNIFIGGDLKSEIKNFAANEKFSKKAMLITDSNIEKIFADQIVSLLESAGLNVKIFVVPAGETSKSLSQAEKIYTAAIEYGLDRKSAIFALGGGVVGDLAGFIAATYLRGLPFVQIPTSLLAQVDSSVGGKVAVNHQLGKNLIGAFYQPKAVFIDLNFLKTLPEREIKSGLGEIVKYGVISDKNFFDYLNDNADKILTLDHSIMEKIISRSCEIKANVVSHDEKESGLRRILNFGHTMAHSIEEASGYSRYTHGEAVAVGMIGAAFISRELKMIGDEEFKRLENLINKLKMISHVENCDVDHMFKSIFRDKKTINGKISWVLMKSIGEVSINSNVPDEIVKEAFDYIVK
ncbi:MAG: 3-dehydroquinate synthase [Selenomonadaceae bacterium]|nr:3-dehydroquinate synthase [Selenomonadaceae bacterium]